MKGLVIGGGSIGARHLENLRTLGVAHLAMVEPDAARLADLIKSSDVKGFAAIEAGFDWNPNFVVVATPSNSHIEPAMMAARRGVDLFVEKPLSHNSDRLEELANLVEKMNLVSLVGCNMRFHPGPAVIKEILDDDRLGKILFSRIQIGAYLPEWRMGQDYRENYAARVETGGGCILDCVHEIDLARWYLGNIARVFCFAGHLSSLEIETEDVAAMICHHASGAISEIHLDYVQRTYQRDCQVVGELGSILWNFNLGSVRWFNAAKNLWTIYAQPENWSVNDMYVEEMKHFLACIATRNSTTLTIPNAVDLMRVVFAAKLSARNGNFVSAEGERVCS